MAKGKKAQQKAVKKAPTQTLKEKRAAKASKRKGKKDDSIDISF